MMDSRRILLAEDDTVVRAVAGEILRDAGYQVVPVADGTAALAAMENWRPDLIVSDVRMPRCDGFELLRRVREHPVLGLVPFVIVSARTDTADQRMGMSLGADDYVTKPFEPSDLLKTIEARLRRSCAISDVLKENRRFLTSALPHELRTPLAGIIGFADVLTQTGLSGQTLSPAELVDFGTDLQRSGRRLLRTAEDFTLWANLEALRESRRAGLPIDDHPTSIGPDWVATIASERARAYGRPDDLSVDVASAALQVPQEGIDRVLWHLIDNAFKFSLPGSPVMVAGRSMLNHYELTITDRGRGMTLEQLSRGGAIRPPARGRLEPSDLGLGLALARRFARLGGGRLQLEANQDGVGLTVRFMLSLASMAADSGTEPNLTASNDSEYPWAQ